MIVYTYGKWPAGSFSPAGSRRSIRFDVIILARIGSQPVLDLGRFSCDLVARVQTNSSLLGTAANSVQSTGIGRQDGQTVAGLAGSNVTIHGTPGSPRTATVTRTSDGKVPGTDNNGIVTGIALAN